MAETPRQRLERLRKKQGELPPAPEPIAEAPAPNEMEAALGPGAAIPLEAIPPAEGVGERLSTGLDALVEKMGAAALKVPLAGPTLKDLLPSRVENAHKLDIAEKEGGDAFLEEQANQAGHPTEDVVGSVAMAGGALGKMFGKGAGQLAREEHVLQTTAAKLGKKIADARGHPVSMDEMAKIIEGLRPAASELAAHGSKNVLQRHPVISTLIGGAAAKETYDALKKLLGL